IDQYKKSKLEEKETANKQKKEALKAGDWVALSGQDTVGEVMNVKGKQAQVRFGNIISFIDLKKLEKRTQGQARQSERKQKIGGLNLADKMARFSGEINVRGMRAEEALVKVDEYIDEAILLGMDQVRIMHGKGYGILRD